MRSVIATVAAKGYAAATVSDIVEGARVSRETFYEHFADKETCFVAASEDGAELMFARVSAAPRALGAQAPAAQRLRAGTRAYLRFLSDEPEFARTFLLEILSAGPTARERRVAAHDRFAALTRRWHAQARLENPSWPDVPDAAYLAMVGAFYELAAKYVRENRIDELPGLEDPIMEIQLAVFTRRDQ